MDTLHRTARPAPSAPGASGAHTALPAVLPDVPPDVLHACGADARDGIVDFLRDPALAEHIHNAGPEPRHFGDLTVVRHGSDHVSVFVPLDIDVLATAAPAVASGASVVDFALRIGSRNDPPPVAHALLASLHALLGPREHAIFASALAARPSDLAALAPMLPGISGLALRAQQTARGPALAFDLSFGRAPQTQLSAGTAELRDMLDDPAWQAACRAAVASLWERGAQAQPSAPLAYRGVECTLTLTNTRQVWPYEPVLRLDMRGLTTASVLDADRAVGHGGPAPFAQHMAAVWSALDRATWFYDAYARRVVSRVEPGQLSAEAVCLALNTAPATGSPLGPAMNIQRLEMPAQHVLRVTFVPLAARTDA